MFHGISWHVVVRRSRWTWKRQHVPYMPGEIEMNLSLQTHEIPMESLDPGRFWPENRGLYSFQDSGSLCRAPKLL